MSLLSHERYCGEVIAETELLCTALRDADVSTPVPTCPDWTLAQLVLHLGGAHRAVEAVVRTRATEFAVPDVSREAGGPDPADAAALAAWLTEGAATLVATLREAGPDARVWTFGGEQPAAFWFRRMAHETVIHRADAFAAVGSPFAVAPEVAADCLDEWLDMLAFLRRIGRLPELSDVTGPDRTLHLHATDTAPELDAEWVIDCTQEHIAWRRAHEKAAVAVRGPLADLLCLIYRRLPLKDADRIEVVGDRELLEAWLERAKF
ncbi:maleylpyruvate isomerase family mycothiol-dependent enzyme [Streptomyces cinnamoneus]|uniref:maleylpyruvate isomerase family mycothiol-dependent enzyme n=1 Tax=Streptomyces cinnamoneus TaxID=53446 RepID=UPI0037992559